MKRLAYLAAFGVFVTAIAAAVLVPTRYVCPPNHRVNLTQPGNEGPACIPVRGFHPIKAHADNRVLFRSAIVLGGTVVALGLVILVTRRPSGSLSLP